MTSKAQNRTPGKALKDIMNTSQTPAAAGKRSKLGHDRLDSGATVDVGALLRGSLLVPKLRGQQDQQQPSTLALTGARKEASPSSFLQPNPVYSPGLSSPDDSLAAAASKIALLKASRMGSQANLKPAVGTSQGNQKIAAARQPTLPTQEPKDAHNAVTEITFDPRSTHTAVQAQLSSPAPQDPDYQQQENMPSIDCQESELPLAARTAIGKRQRRKSQHHGPQRFGEWFAGDDDQLEATLAEYNLTQQQEGLEPRMTRAQRRKSALPALGASMIAGSDSLAEGLQREPSEEEKAADSRKEVADKVQAIASELCSQLDSIIESSPKEKGRRRRHDDDKSLHEKLVEAWDGKSYYERLKQMADKDQGSSKQEEEQAPASTACAAASKRPPKLNIKLQPTVSAPASSARGAKTPGRARRAQQLTELTESLKKLQVSSAHRTSKAAAVLGGLRSAPGSRTASPTPEAAFAMKKPASPEAKDASCGQHSSHQAAKQAGESSADTGKAKRQGPPNKPDVPLKAATSQHDATAKPQTHSCSQVSSSGAAAKPTLGAQSPGQSLPDPVCAGEDSSEHAPSKRVTRAQSKSPEPPSQPLGGVQQKKRAGRKGSTPPVAPACSGAAGLSSSPAVKMATNNQDELAELRAALEAANKLANSAMEGKQLAEGRERELQCQLVAEKKSRKELQQQADELAAQLKEESKARRAAECKVNDLGGQVEELQKRAEQADAAERTLGRVAEKATEFTARHQAAENQVASILKAANTLAQALAQGKEEAQALQELTVGKEGAATVPSARSRHSNTKQTSVGWR